MLSASSADAIGRGDYFAVLGEIHVALNTIEPGLFVHQHPAPQELIEAAASDFPEPRVLAIRSKDAGSGRVSNAIITSTDFEIETAFDSSVLPRDRVLLSADLFVEDDRGELVVSSDDGVHRFPLLDVLNRPLREAMTNELTIAPSADHTPRIQIDKLVVCRESWRIAPSTMPFALASSDVDIFVGAARWARDRGLPRFVFVKSPIEVKPIFVDFASIVGVRIFAKLVRRAKEYASGEQILRITEMLPSFEDTWLTDHEGERYTCELRVVAVDERR
jgi:hypothetical protein